mgnify:CR=1 FL=1
MKIQDLATKEVYNIELFKAGGEEKMKCPVCSHTRKKKNLKCLSWNHSKDVGFCSHCRASFVPHKYKEKEYVKPEWKNNTELSDKVVKWFEGRGISQFTLRQMKVTEGREFMPQTGKEENTIQFNYFRNGELINVKYRDGAKNFKLHKDSELIVYNYDNVKDEKEIIIVEGEMDALSLYEAGHHNVMSVPNGASGGSINLEYIDNSFELFVDKTFIIATDTDLPGVKLRNELAARLGIENCKRVDFKECKDANEYLMKYGAPVLYECFNNAKDFPIDGIFNSQDIREELYELYENGMPPAMTVGYLDFDKKISFDYGRLYTFTGIPGHGKSEFVDQLCVLLNIKHNLKVGYFSPENTPIQFHESKIIEKIVGKTFSRKFMNKAELEEAIDYTRDNFYHILPEEDLTIDNILSKARHLVKSKGIKVLVIDPYNTINHNRGSDNEHEYVSKFMSKLQLFARMNQIMIFLVAHPRKIEKRGDGTYNVPTLYDISGSSHFFNKTDFGITVYRNFTDNSVEVHIQKVKFKHMGEVGMCEFSWKYTNGRYCEWYNRENEDKNLLKKYGEYDTQENDNFWNEIGKTETPDF